MPSQDAIALPIQPVQPRPTASAWAKIAPDTPLPPEPVSFGTLVKQQLTDRPTMPDALETPAADPILDEARPRVFAEITPPPVHPFDKTHLPRQILKHALAVPDEPVPPQAADAVRLPADLSPPLAVPIPASEQSAPKGRSGGQPQAADAATGVPTAPHRPDGPALPQPQIAGSTEFTLPAPRGAPTSVVPATVRPPAEQLAPVVVSVAGGPAGDRRITLLMQPPELGHLQIHIEHVPEAPLRVDISVERSETLAMLQHDSQQLRHALDQAGVPSDTVTITFHPTPIATPVQPSAGTDQPSQQFLGTGQFGHGHRDAPAHPRPEAADRSAGPPERPEGQSLPAPIYRSGIDITA